MKIAIRTDPELKSIEEALQVSEKNYRQIIESSPDCIKELDLEGRLLAMNKNGMCVMEIADFTPLKNKDWCQLWGSEHEAPIKAAIAEALKGNIGRFTGFCPTAKGTPKWWDVMVTPILGIDHKPVRLLAVSRDITEIKQGEQKVKEFNEELKISNIDLERFAFVASHDLKSPLSLIINYVQLMKKRYKDKLGTDGERLIEDMDETLQRMNNVIQSLLNYSLISGKEVTFQPVDTSQCIEDAVANLTIVIKKDKAQIEYHHLPQIMGDENLITVVFQNLIQNAIKFRGSEIPHIKISARENDQECVFCIQDNGIGIKPEYFDKIFDVFRRGEDSEKYEGAGIGLATCKRIVERHRGRIWVESEYTKGSRFYIAIPKEKI